MCKELMLIKRGMPLEKRDGDWGWVIAAPVKVKHHSSFILWKKKNPKGEKGRSWTVTAGRFSRGGKGQPVHSILPATYCKSISSSSQNHGRGKKKNLAVGRCFFSQGWTLDRGVRERVFFDPLRHQRRTCWSPASLRYARACGRGRPAGWSRRLHGTSNHGDRFFFHDASSRA